MSPETKQAELTNVLTTVDRLVDIADSIFERAIKLDGIKVIKKEEDASQTITEMRDECFEGVIATWRVIEEMLPNSGIEYTRLKELEVDGYKVISRCYHNLGQLKEAAEAITTSIDMGYTDGYISLGAICLDLEEYDKAENAFHSAISKDAQPTRAQAGLGELYFALGTMALKENDGKHVAYFEKAEEAFMLAGRERFAESYERAMDLFETIGWKDRAVAFGEKAALFYATNRLHYGDRLRAMDGRMRRLTGDDRYERILAGVSRTLGNIVGGKKPEKDIK
jgi:tetratricopeptide (TPR) repeat protein